MSILKTKTKPFFSIITVVLNGENTIEKTIQSVLKQPFKDFEYIIIDGMSNDKTISIVNTNRGRVENTKSTKTYTHTCLL